MIPLLYVFHFILATMVYVVTAVDPPAEPQILPESTNSTTTAGKLKYVFVYLVFLKTSIF